MIGHFDTVELDTMSALFKGIATKFGFKVAVKLHLYDISHSKLLVAKNKSKIVYAGHN